MEPSLIQNLVTRQNVAMVGYVTKEGFPCIKAMLAPRYSEGLTTFYFTTNTSCEKVLRYRHNPKACVYFLDENTFEGVTFTGTMEVLEDSKNKERIWQPGDVLYYPKGVTDPDYCVLRFTAQKACYYHGLQQITLDL